MDQNNPLYKNKHYIVVEGSYRYSIPAIKFYEVREIQPIGDGINLYPFVTQFSSSQVAIAHADKLSREKKQH